MYQVLNTAIAAEQFGERDSFTVSHEGAAEYPAYTSYFFNVPKNTSAFKIDLKLQQGSVRLQFMRPTGKEVDDQHVGAGQRALVGARARDRDGVSSMRAEKLPDVAGTQWCNEALRPASITAATARSKRCTPASPRCRRR